MPELPEVETTRRGIAPALSGRLIDSLLVRNSSLRWPIPDELATQIRGATTSSLDRRAKYLLLRTNRGTAIMHLGMSGSLRICDPEVEPGRHDHYDILVDTGAVIRFNDPRRFGCLLWTTEDPAHHPLLIDLGPEPFSKTFTGTYLYHASRSRSVAIKQQLMNSRIVAGVGNIYANEALFRARIHPARAAGRISRQRMDLLVEQVRSVLEESIRAGGTTLRDFYGTDGRPGYFRPKLLVYGREGAPCPACGAELRQSTIGQRSTFYCPRCQR